MTTELRECAERLVANCWDVYLHEPPGKRKMLDVADRILFDGRTVAQDWLKNSWISVTDELPPIETCVLAWGKKTFGDVEILQRQDPNERLGAWEESWLSIYWLSKNGGARCHVYDEKGNVSSESISHWMPIPGPPQSPQTT